MLINYSRVDASSTKAIISLMNIVRYHNKKDLKIKIIQNMHLIIQSINFNQVYYLDIILTPFSPIYNMFIFRCFH